MTLKTIGHLFYTALRFVRHFKVIGEFNLELQSGNAQFGSKLTIFVPRDLEIWRVTLKNNRALLLRCAKLCASLHSRHWIKTGVTVRKLPIRIKIDDFLQCDLEIWRMTMQNNKAPILSNIKLCAWFHYHMWIQNGVTVWKRLSWVLTSVASTFDLWPWIFAWTSRPSMVITPENFRMILWQEHCQNGVRDGRTDRQMNRRKEVFLELFGRS